MKRLVKLTLKSGEKIICILIKKLKNRYIFEKNNYAFSIDKDEIKYIDMIGEIYDKKNI